MQFGACMKNYQSLNLSVDVWCSTATCELALNYQSVTALALQL